MTLITKKASLILKIDHEEFIPGVPYDIMVEIPYDTKASLDFCMKSDDGKEAKKHSIAWSKVRELKILEYREADTNMAAQTKALAGVKEESKAGFDIKDFIGAIDHWVPGNTDQINFTKSLKIDYVDQQNFRVYCSIEPSKGPSIQKGAFEATFIAHKRRSKDNGIVITTHGALAVECLEKLMGKLLAELQRRGQ